MSSAKHGLANCHKVCNGVVSIADELNATVVNEASERTDGQCTSCRLFAIKA